MSRTIIDINILQTVPPSNLNRDDTGTPKTATFGGVPRARVSSQAWKRATRMAFKQHLDASMIGTRTKQVVEHLASTISSKDTGVTREEALDLATATLTTAGVKLSPPRVKKGAEPGPHQSEYLLFLSSLQMNHLAEAALNARAGGDVKRDLKAAQLKKSLNLDHSVDIALFGRMVADSTDLNVDAAAQVAHALSVHAVNTEFDFYTAVDDYKARDEEADDAGAAMMGVVEFNSSTLYRYATVDANRLLDNLGSIDATKQAVQAFAEAFALSMPTGKQNTFANRTLPDAVIVTIRSTQPVNLAGAFEEAVEAPYLAHAAEALAEHVRGLEENYSIGSEASWVVRTKHSTKPLDALGQRTSFESMVKELGETVSQRLQETA